MKFPKPLQLTLAKTEDIFERALDLVHRYVDNITFSSEVARNEMRTIGNLKYFYFKKKKRKFCI
jgi:hypothetical protein